MKLEKDWQGCQMDLDEAIEHALEMGNKDACSACGAEHLQLAAWLVELKILRERNDGQQTLLEPQRTH